MVRNLQMLRARGLLRRSTAKRSSAGRTPRLYRVERRRRNVSISDQLPNLESAIFRLAESYVFELVINDATTTLRVELFESLDEEGCYRCIVWETEVVNVGISVMDENGVSHNADWSTKIVAVDWGAYLKGDYSCFRAPSIKAALEMVVADIRREVIRSS